MSSDAEFQLRRIADQADRARAYVEDPLLVGAFERLEQQFTAAWRSTHATDTAGREALWHHIQALGEVRAELNRVLVDGEMAKAELAEIRAGISQP